MGHSDNTPWTEIGAIARRQWSQLRTDDLRAAGLSLKAIRLAVRRGQLYLAHQGVYSLGHPIASPQERAMAAVLAYAPEGLLAGRWALWNFGLVRLPSHPPEVAANPSRTRRPGITLHRCRSLEPDANFGIPTTTPNRSIIDSAPFLDDQQLRRVVNQAQILRLTTAESLRTEAKVSQGVPTRRLLAELPLDRRGATRSLLEDLLEELHRDRGLPLPLINHRWLGKEWDFSFPHLALIIEADGYETHWTRQAFEDDHLHRLTAEAAGVRVVAVTYRQVTDCREQTADQLVAVIEQRSAALALPLP